MKTEMEKPVTEKRFGDLLRKVVAIIAQLNELYTELDTQGKCVQKLIGMAQTSTRRLSTKTSESYNIRRQFLTEERDQTRIDELLSHLTEDDTKHLSIPVQETQTSFRVRHVGAPVREIPYSSGGASDEKAGGESTAEELGRPIEEEPRLFSHLARAPPVEGASACIGGREFPRRHEESSGGLSSGSAFEVWRPSFDRVERTEWTGESDIEVIEESDQHLGATSMQGKLCPVCESYFPSIRSQDEFERHVRSHFDDE